MYVAADEMPVTVTSLSMEDTCTPAVLGRCTEFPYDRGERVGMPRPSTPVYCSCTVVRTAPPCRNLLGTHPAARMSNVTFHGDQIRLHDMVLPASLGDRGNQPLIPYVYAYPEGIPLYPLHARPGHAHEEHLVGWYSVNAMFRWNNSMLVKRGFTRPDSFFHPPSSTAPNCG